MALPGRSTLLSLGPRASAVTLEEPSGGGRGFKVHWKPFYKRAKLQMLLESGL